jgi:HEPN domain-containing protein
MNMRDLARAYLRDAKVRFDVAEGALVKGQHHFTVRPCQEATELALKAALRYVNIDAPKWHDVGDVLKQNRHKFPPQFARDIDRFAAYSQRLRVEREPSMYGDEELGLPPEALYSEEDARRAIAEANEVLTACEKLIE